MYACEYDFSIRITGIYMHLERIISSCYENVNRIIGHIEHTCNWVQPVTTLATGTNYSLLDGPDMKKVTNDTYRMYVVGCS